MPSRLTVLNPGSVKVTVYVPGTRLTILYWPSPSVTAVRTFSMSAGLAASTVTPGMTAPLVSLTTPAMVWANVVAGNRTRNPHTTRRAGTIVRRIITTSGRRAITFDKRC